MLNYMIDEAEINYQSLHKSLMMRNNGIKVNRCYISSFLSFNPAERWVGGRHTYIGEK